MMAMMTMMVVVLLPLIIMMIVMFLRHHAAPTTRTTSARDIPLLTELVLLVPREHKRAMARTFMVYTPIIPTSYIQNFLWPQWALAQDLYSRAVATVLNDAGVAMPAYVYHRTGKFDRTSCSLVCLILLIKPPEPQTPHP